MPRLCFFKSCTMPRYILGLTAIIGAAVLPLSPLQLWNARAMDATAGSAAVFPPTCIQRAALT